MLRYWQQFTMTAYRHCRFGMAFNVMSTLVDWERDDLFHLPFDVMATFVRKHLSRHFVIRHDYQAYEYTTMSTGSRSIAAVKPQVSSDPRMAAGYCHRQYAESFAEVGQPRELPNCGGWLIERAIPGSALRDGMGCYPLFDCCNWAGLPLDFAGLTERLVSVTLVVNPFADVAEADLRRWFDVVIPFKQHYVTDLRRPVDDFVGRQHRRNLQKSRGLVQVDVCQTPLDLLDEWCDLYGHLAARHDITGLRAFSRSAFEKQLGVPGLVMFRALADDEIVGLHLW